MSDNDPPPCIFVLDPLSVGPVPSKHAVGSRGADSLSWMPFLSPKIIKSPNSIPSAPLHPEFTSLLAVSFAVSPNWVENRVAFVSEAHGKHSYSVSQRIEHY